MQQKTDPMLVFKMQVAAACLQNANTWSGSLKC